MSRMRLLTLLIQMAIFAIICQLIAATTPPPQLLDLEPTTISFSSNFYQQDPIDPPTRLGVQFAAHNQQFSYTLQYNQQNTTQQHYPFKYSFDNVNYTTRVSITFYGEREFDYFGYIVQDGVHYELGTITTFASLQGITVSPIDNEVETRTTISPLGQGGDPHNQYKPRYSISSTSERQVYGYSDEFMGTLDTELIQQSIDHLHNLLNTNSNSKPTLFATSSTTPRQPITHQSIVINKRQYQQAQNDLNDSSFSPQASSSAVLLPFQLSPTLQQWPNCIKASQYNFPIHLAVHQMAGDALANAGIISSSTYANAYAFLSTISQSFLDLFNPITRYQIGVNLIIVPFTTSFITSTNQSDPNQFTTTGLPTPPPITTMQPSANAGHFTMTDSRAAFTLDVSRFYLLLHRAFYAGILTTSSFSDVTNANDRLTRFSTEALAAQGLLSNILPLLTASGSINGQVAHIAGDVGYSYDFRSTAFCTNLSTKIANMASYGVTVYTPPTPTCGNGIVEGNEECDETSIYCSNTCKYNPGYDCSIRSGNILPHTQCCVNGLMQSVQTTCGDDGTGVCQGVFGGACYPSTCLNSGNLYNPYNSQQNTIINQFTTYTNATQLQWLACNFNCPTNDSRTNINTSAPLGSKCIYYRPGVYTSSGSSTPKPFYGSCQRPTYDQNDPNSQPLGSSSTTVLCTGGFEEPVAYNEINNPEQPTITYTWVPASDQYPICSPTNQPIMDWKCIRTDTNQSVNLTNCQSVQQPTTNFVCSTTCGTNNDKTCANNGGVCVATSSSTTMNKCTTDSPQTTFSFKNPKCFINSQSVDVSRCQLFSQPCSDISECPLVITYKSSDGVVDGYSAQQITSQFCPTTSQCGLQTYTFIPTCTVSGNVYDCTDSTFLQQYNNNQPVQTDFSCTNYKSCTWSIGCPNLAYQSPTATPNEKSYLPCQDAKTTNCSALGTCIASTVVTDRTASCVGTNPTTGETFLYNSSIHSTLPAGTCQLQSDSGFYTCPAVDTTCTFNVKCKPTQNSGQIEDCTALSTYCPSCANADVVLTRQDDVTTDPIIGCYNVDLDIFTSVSTSIELGASRCSNTQSDLFSYTCVIGPTMPKCQYNLTCLDIVNSTPSNQLYVDCTTLPIDQVIDHYCIAPLDPSTDPCGAREVLDMKCSFNGDSSVSYTDFPNIEHYCSEDSEQFYVKCPSTDIECPCDEITNGLTTALNSGLDCTVLPELKSLHITIPTLSPQLTPNTYTYQSNTYSIMYSEQFVTFSWEYLGRTTNKVNIYLHSINSNTITQLYNVRSPSKLTPIVPFGAPLQTARVYIPAIQGLAKFILVIDGLLTQQAITNILSTSAASLTLTSDAIYLQNRCLNTPCQHKSTCQTNLNKCLVDQCYGFGCRNFYIPASQLTTPSFMTTTDPESDKLPCQVNTLTQELEQCTCLEPYAGRFCTGIAQCPNDQCQNDGYFPYTSANCNANQSCVCINKWTSTDCSICALGDANQIVNIGDPNATCGANSSPNDKCSECQCSFGYSRPAVPDVALTDLNPVFTRDNIETTGCTCQQAYSMIVLQHNNKTQVVGADAKSDR